MIEPTAACNKHVHTIHKIPVMSHTTRMANEDDARDVDGDRGSSK